MSQLLSLQARTASPYPVQSFSYYTSEQAIRVSPESTSSATPGSIFMKPDEPLERLTIARHAGGTVVSLQFADGHTARLNLADLGIDTTVLRLATVCASSWGSALEVEDATGETVHIDSAVLRAYSDPQYAMELEQDIAKVGRSRSSNRGRRA